MSPPPPMSGPEQSRELRRIAGAISAKARKTCIICDKAVEVARELSEYAETIKNKSADEEECCPVDRRCPKCRTYKKQKH